MIIRQGSEHNMLRGVSWSAIPRNFLKNNCIIIMLAEMSLSLFLTKIKLPKLKTLKLVTPILSYADDKV
ncbi:MAG: hypothetical protein E6K94_02605 [Thaumarchaeota archaeon]|nr:MAG: hypothetical protein E6K94_02605 [Nitrososphaerota archaeon]